MTIQNDPIRMTSSYCKCEVRSKKHVCTIPDCTCDQATLGEEGDIVSGIDCDCLECDDVCDACLGKEYNG